MNHRDTFSLPKCLLLASGDFFTTESSTFVPICQHHQSPSSGFSKVFQTARSSSRTIQHLQQTPIPPCVGRRITLSTCSGYLRSFNAFACRSPWRASSVISIHHEFIPHFLHSHPAPFLSPAQLVPLCITAADIMLALKEIQPSAQREALRLCLMSHGRTLVRCTLRTASWTWPSYSLFTDRSFFALTRRWACSLESSGMRKDIIG